MANFNPKKLQVFVSSTFTDLIPERQSAVEAILTAGHIPAGMELFTAGDETQMDVIRQWIDESDVYVLILGARYGSIEPKTGKSYIQVEYEYALSRNKPLFACVIDEKVIDDRVKKFGMGAIETENSKALKEFRAQVLSRMSKFWQDGKDIKIVMAETLSTLSRRSDLTGWVRATNQSNVPALADEIARLSKENADLRSQLSTVRPPETINGISFRELKAILERKQILDFFVSHRIALQKPRMYSQFKDELKELQLHGLVESSQEPWFVISQSGRVFLNMIEAAKMAEELTKPGDA